MILPEKGQRYTVICQRHRTGFQPTYEGRFLGMDGADVCFELEGSVRLRVSEWALVDLEPVAQ